MGRFDGAWEEKGVIGPRLEIDGDKVIFLWQASVVLETRFDTVQEGGKTVLRLEHNGLRNEGSLDPYAVITEFYFNGTALITVADFRFSGKCETRFFPTSNSRYGNVTLVNDEYLPQLCGVWESKYTDLVFDGETLRICGHGMSNPELELTIVCARPNSSPDKVAILDKDPSKHNIGDFYSVIFSGGKITASIEVCDDRPVNIDFTKKA